MSIIMPASVICLVILLIGSWKTKNLYFYCMLATLVLFIVALIITVGIEVPIDNQIRTWMPAAMPADWQGIRNKWEFPHHQNLCLPFSNSIPFNCVDISQTGC